MFGLVIVAWTGFVAAALSVFGFIASMEIYFLVLAFSAMATGSVFLALDRIVTHLATISNALARAGAEPTSIPNDVPSPPLVVRDIADTQRDIERLKVQASGSTDQASISARNALLSGRITQSKFGKYIVADRQFDSLIDAESYLNRQGS